MKPKPIYKKGIRILRPFEFDEIIDALQKTQNKRRKHPYREIINALLYTGMRYVELQRFHEHPEWFDRRTRSIFLPPEASQKKKRTMNERYVYLSLQGITHVENFINYVEDMPSRDMFNYFIRNFVRKIDGYDRGVSAKTFRKTWESWLVVSYPNQLPIIAMSQGHTLLTAMNHYLNIPFTKEDIVEIKMRTAGWSGAGVGGEEDE